MTKEFLNNQGDMKYGQLTADRLVFDVHLPEKTMNTINKGKWKRDEHERFLEACFYFNNDWNKIVNYVKTRNLVQIRSHAQKYLIKICKKYKIKLSTKKFKNKDSNHLKVYDREKRFFSNISDMNDYDKNIIRLFNYYHREWEGLKDEKLSNAISETIKKSDIKFHTIKDDSINLDINKSYEHNNYNEEYNIKEILKKNHQYNKNREERFSPTDIPNSESANKNVYSGTIIMNESNSQDEIKKTYPSKTIKFRDTNNLIFELNSPNYFIVNNYFNENKIQSDFLTPPNFNYNNIYYIPEIRDINFLKKKRDNPSINSKDINNIRIDNLSISSKDNLKHINFRENTSYENKIPINYEFFEHEIQNLIYNNNKTTQYLTDNIINFNLEQINKLHNFSKTQNIQSYFDSKSKIEKEFYSLLNILESNKDFSFISKNLDQMEKVLSINNFFTSNACNNNQYFENCKYFWDRFMKENDLYEKNDENVKNIL